jgi:NAD(P)-dependent dehydrogenase (short-subunit alcohol dehydrogenase family)
MRKWTPSDMPDLSGKQAVVTGANKSLGFFTALELARHGAEVTLGCRDAGRGKAAAQRIGREVPGAAARLSLLDLADLSSVRRFADDYLSGHESLDILVNNAGVLALPKLETADGFEMQFGTNYLGHFALTGLLLPALLARPGARVVNLSTFVVNWIGDLDFSNLQGERKYNKWDAYNQSKLANLVFAQELSRRYAERKLAGVAAHPGFAVSDLQYAAPRMAGSKLRELFFKIPTVLFAKPTAMGAWPSLYAATADCVEPGACYAPQGRLQIRGSTGKVRMPARATDPETGRRLWEVSERLTGVVYGSLPSALG